MPKLINRLIKVLVVSDFFLNLGWGLMGPIFAIFIVQSVALGDASEAARVAGFAALIFWILKSGLQIPVGEYLDRNHGEHDDFWFMVAGTFLSGFVPLGYVFSFEPWHIYLLQILHAVAAGVMVPAYSAIFTRHIDKGREALEWSLWSTSIGFGAGIAGGVGGVAVSIFGFSWVFIAVAALTFVSAWLLLFIKDDISPKNKDTIRIPLERKIVEP